MAEGPRWDLELSQTSVHWLLAYWSEKFEVLDAYCDESKPIESNREVFDQFIGRKDKAYIQLGEHQCPSVVYNLSRSINLVDSKQFPGVQLADVLASSLAYALKNKTEDFSQECLSLAKDAIVNAVFPDMGQMDLATEKASLNLMILLETWPESQHSRDRRFLGAESRWYGDCYAVYRLNICRIGLEYVCLACAILLELVDRSIKGRDLFEGMGDYIMHIRSAIPDFLPQVSWRDATEGNQ